MQINNFRKNMTNTSGIGDAAALKNERGKVTEESFQDSLQKSMVMERADGEGEIRADHVGKTGDNAVSRKKQGFAKGKAGEISIRVGRGGETLPAKEVAVRRLSYGECDKVEINVLEGYTLKAKLEGKAGDGNAGGCRIYVEMKDEEGAVKACLFDGTGLRGDSGSAMERIAYAVMQDREER